MQACSVGLVDSDALFFVAPALTLELPNVSCLPVFRLRRRGRWRPDPQFAYQKGSGLLSKQVRPAEISRPSPTVA